MYIAQLARDLPSVPGLLQCLWPWPDEPRDCCCVATRFSWGADCLDRPAGPDIDIPPWIARAAPRRRAEYIAGRCCAGEALRRLTGKTTFPGQAEDRAPVWPRGTIGSISHSGDVAIAVAGSSARYCGLGVDIEKPLTEAEAREIAPQALTERELQRLRTPADAFLIGLTFSAKESLFKALYPTVRRYFGFHASQLVTWNPAGTGLLSLTRDLSPEWRRGQEIPLHFCCLENFVATRVSIEWADRQVDRASRYELY
nr:4'-phosphopantetheinyl transferase superfamily protein [Mesorhizobium sp. RMAD-H1]